MPELPEVETIRKDLVKMIIGKKISSVDIMETRSVKNRPLFFKKNLTDKHFISVKRKGKLLFIGLSSGRYLLVRLGMTGQLIYGPERCPTKHTRVIFRLKDNSSLFFNDIRKFGFLFLATKHEKDAVLDNIGIDPLDHGFTLKHFRGILKDRRGTLKAFLLDQHIISGIGNIYADEICFRSGLRPDGKIENLTDKKIKKLYNDIREILSLAIKHRGTTFSDYVDARGNKGSFIKMLMVYQKEKECCRKCKERSIRKIVTAGRSTRYCENCQS